MLLGCGDVLLKNDLRSLPVVLLLLYVGADANENVSCCTEVRSRFLAKEEDMFVRGGVSVIIIEYCMKTVHPNSSLFCNEISVLLVLVRYFELNLN